MRQRVSDYIADFLAAKGLKQIFTVVGGGAMHLNDSLGHHAELNCLYHHHEQAAAMAAEAYSRISKTPGVVCVTSGPGAINALNGVAGAYQDSIPLLVFSGQVKTSLTVKSSGLSLRTLGGQEFDIVSAVGNMTKYAVTVMDPNDIRRYLEKALFLAGSGRPGPCWLDIPVDVQGAVVEIDELAAFTEWEPVSTEPVAWNILLDRLRTANCPVVYAGNSIRTSGGYGVFRKLMERLRIPVVTCWNSIDLLPTEHPLYAGRGGTMGDRAGNFAVQNSDLVLSLGCRLSIYQVGYDVRTWARGAYVAAVDIDADELKKPTIRVDLPICMDVCRFMEELLGKTADEEFQYDGWLRQCQKWKQDYPVVLERHYIQRELCNVYAFIDTLGRLAPEGAVTVAANGSASVVGSQAMPIKEDQRFIMNCALSSMGYGLPASIGACIANGKSPVVCLTGDGSIQMNLQELQTVLTNRLPIKIFVINNQGYHQIRLTQQNLFKGRKLVGVGPESEDLGFPSMEKLAWAYGYPYFCCKSNQDLKKFVEQAVGCVGPVIAEVFADTAQVFEPKSATRKLPDGRLESPPLEDLAPFLPREELAEIMRVSKMGSAR